MEPLNEPKTATLPNESLFYLREAGKWSRWLSMLMFIVMGLVLLVMIGFGVVLGLETGTVGLSIGMVLTYGVFIGIMLIPYYFAFRFAAKIKQGIATLNDENFTDAFASLKSHFKTLAIIMIVTLALYVIMIPFYMLFLFNSGGGIPFA